MEKAHSGEFQRIPVGQNIARLLTRPFDSDLSN